MPRYGVVQNIVDKVFNEPINHGDILLIDYKQNIGREQGGIRPSIVLSNEKCNIYSPVITVAPLTGQIKKALSVHVLVDSNAKNGLREKSVVLLEQIRVIDKTRIVKKLGTIDDSSLVNKIKTAAANQLCLVLA